ncbi:UDP-N-acetylmuramate dehydrogenase [Providencia manganoxydans]|uniref:UDP-N-acetylmuramate dehydrogenase n=1 Tax=Providencia manganoxydans TaxID=2923283 RepID=UPI0034DD0E2A
MKEFQHTKESRKCELSNNTYWGIGGPCERFYIINNNHQLRALLNNPINTDLITIGNGTNLLFDSEGYQGTIVKLGAGFDFINVLDDCVEVGASTWVPGLVRNLSTLGFGSLDHCVGIPATIGGLIAMNGGSQRRSISEVINSVEVMDFSGKIFHLDNKECEFNYRHSIFSNDNFIILSAKLNVEKIQPNSNRKNLIEILRERRLKFPRKQPNCGSVFKSSPELYKKIGPPGLIIESLGLKGFSIGGAKVSEIHANFIVNTGEATSKDVIEVVDHINQMCFLKYGFEMEAEAIFVDQFGNSTPLHKVTLIDK